MKAVIIGATGATGKDLLNQLLADPDFESVTIFVRRDPGIVNPKLTTVTVDFNDIPSWADQIHGNVFFSVLGTTRAAAGSKAAQWKVDYTYQLEVAKAAKKNGVPVMELMSAWGAEADSCFFYTRMKGELEEAITDLEFKKLIIVRPPSLIRSNTDRFGEKVSLAILRALNTIGLFKSMQPMSTSDVAKVMIRTAKNKGIGNRILEPEEMRIVAL